MDDSRALLKKIEEIKSEWLATVDAIVTPIMYVRKDYTIFKANKALAKLAGVGIKKVVGMKCYQALAKRKSPCEGCQLQEAIKDKSVVRWDLKGIREGLFFEATSQPLPTEAAIQVYRDCTEQKLLAEKLKQSDKMAAVGLLASGLAHEVNNPLAGILAFSQMLLKELPKDNVFYSDVVEIEGAAQRCKNIVSSMLDFSRSGPLLLERPGKKLGPTKLQSVNVTAALGSALRFSRFLPQARRVKVKEEWSLTEAVIAADKNSIVQLFLNLIQNAMQSMPKGGSLTLCSYQRKSKGQAFGCWEVKDSGVGIDPKNLARIFDPFFTTKNADEGTGLGLSICKAICQDFGGKIEVETTKGKGSTFRVVFPLLKP